MKKVFGLLHVIFTLRVGNYRFKSKISGKLLETAATRIAKPSPSHGNFIENVPIALFLILLNEYKGAQDSISNNGVDSSSLSRGSLMTIVTIRHSMDFAALVDARHSWMASSPASLMLLI